MVREIHPDHLYLGNAMDARDLRLLYDNRIAAVVDLAVDEPPAQLARDMIYCRIPLNDGDGNSTAIIEMAVRCVVTLIEKDIRTMVACSAGMSRSPAIAAAAMAILTRTPADDCLTTITSHAPHDVSPILWPRVKTVYNEIVGN
ncbi:MAG: dual specificity protein phosphatase family protein [Planctomycetota bacterium]